MDNMGDIMPMSSAFKKRGVKSLGVYLKFDFGRQSLFIIVK